ncbi:MAG: low affinity iron permease family protein [Pseudomonadales bacterium]|nr:low affinity iron permease family protein [Pseudomonadales bacterium]
MNDVFGKIASKISKTAGSVWAFLLACSIVVTWALTGKLFSYSTTWQLFINTMTTIVTFLMVFLIQNTQNRDSKALHLKLDELLKAMKGSSLSMVDIENMSENELEELLERFKAHKDRYEKQLEKKRKN